MAECHPEKEHWAKGLCKLCYGRQWYASPEQRIKHRIRCKKQDARYKQEMFDALGHICACCKEAEKIFLTLDHIEGNGNQHRIALTGNKSDCRSVMFAARREGWPKDKYQILCWNCQFGKQRPEGCPHKRVN